MQTGTLESPPFDATCELYNQIKETESSDAKEQGQRKIEGGK
jgi:hypothetical protein